MIEDKEISQLIRYCEESTKYEMTGEINNQVFRGVSPLHWKNNPCISVPHCDRQMLVFKEEKIIPKYCFSCYKITIKATTVIELLKLAIVFNQLTFADDNTRKCCVDRRDFAASRYVGLVYFQSLQEAKDNLDYVADAVAEQISPDIEVYIKRGCSGFPVAYPEYGEFDSNFEPVMKYPDEWLEKEKSFDEKGLTANMTPYSFDTYDLTNDNEDFTIVEHRKMLYWLCCAATFKDESYRKYTNSNYVLE